VDIDVSEKSAVFIFRIEVGTDMTKMHYTAFYLWCSSYVILPRPNFNHLDVEVEGGRFLRNVRIRLYDYMMSQPRRQ
jgi:hypothetical protein